MAEIKVSMSGFGTFDLTLDIIDPAAEDNDTEVWCGTFCDESTRDCEQVYFEMSDEYELWDLIGEAINTYKDTIEGDNNDAS